MQHLRMYPLGRILPELPVGWEARFRPAGISAFVAVEDRRIAVSLPRLCYTQRLGFVKNKNTPLGYNVSEKQCWAAPRGGAATNGRGTPRPAAQSLRATGRGRPRSALAIEQGGNKTRPDVTGRMSALLRHCA